MIQCQKHLFNLKPNNHYLNCAYKAPLLKSAEEAAIKALIKERNPSDLEVNDFFYESEKVKELFGEIVNCNKNNVALIPSSSYGFSSILNNIPTHKSKKAICVKNEFPSGYFALKRWCENNQNNLEIIDVDPTLKKKGLNWNQSLIDAIDKNTSVVLISSIHWMNGLKFELNTIGEKCKAVGAKFIVDGTQSVGALPMDVISYNIDALVCACYKWLFGPYSMAISYLSDSFNNGTPIEESWMNRTNARDFSGITNYETKYQPKAGRYNVGETSNFILMPILHQGLNQLNSWGIENIQNYCKQLVSPLKSILSDIGIIFEDDKYFCNHLFSLCLPDNIDPINLKQNLDQNNIHISLRGEYLRVSVNVFNDEQDIKQLINVIHKTSS